MTYRKEHRFVRVLLWFGHHIGRNIAPSVSLLMVQSTSGAEHLFLPPRAVAYPWIFSSDSPTIYAGRELLFPIKSTWLTYGLRQPVGRPSSVAGQARPLFVKRES